MNVLIVEDEFLVALHMESILEEAGHTVAGVAATPSEAVALAERTRPDLALCDVRLAHNTSGIQAADWLHGRFAIPCLMVTSACEEARAAVQCAGCLPKPVDPPDLIQSVEAVADLAAGRRPKAIPRRLQLYGSPPTHH